MRLQRPMTDPVLPLLAADFNGRFGRIVLKNSEFQFSADFRGWLDPSQGCNR